MQLPLNRTWITTLLAFFSFNLGRWALLQISFTYKNQIPTCHWENLSQVPAVLC